MATIQDVVDKAGVSIATVSRVINNSPKVLPETREKVLAVIRELDYHPNKLAQQFRSQQTKNILVLLPRAGDEFYADILKGIDRIAQETGYHIFLVNTHNDSQLERYYFETLVQKQYDGIINFSATLPKDYMSEIAQQYPVVVGLRYLEVPGLPNVSIDNLAASREITEYILNLGHNQIAYLCGNSGQPIYMSRLEGFYQALKQRDIPVDIQPVVMTEPDIRGGYDATMKLLQSKAKFTAIIAGGDKMAVGAIKALEANSLRVPEDVAVCGFDDIELSSLLSPTLTTIRQPREMIGRYCIEKLLSRIRGEDNALSDQLVLDYELVIRQSSGKLITA